MANLFQQGLTDELINSYYNSSNNGMSNNGMSNNGMSNNGMMSKENHCQPSKDINRLIENMDLLVNRNKKVQENDKPLGCLTSFLSPQCQGVTIQTIDDDNVNQSESHYVTLVDNEHVNREAFQEYDTVMPGDLTTQVYFASLGVLGLFILYRFMEKSR